MCIQNISNNINIYRTDISTKVLIYMIKAFAAILIDKHAQPSMGSYIYKNYLKEISLQ